MATDAGLEIAPGRPDHLLRVLNDVSDADLRVLSDEIGDWAARPLGRQTLAYFMLQTGTAWLCYLNLEPAGLIAIERREVAARVRALAIAPDLRRRGCARALLAETSRRAAERGLPWVSMEMAASATAAVRCALDSGFRRYRPQYLRRSVAGLPPGAAHRVALAPMEGREAREAIAAAARIEQEAGDRWALDYLSADAPPLPASGDARTFAVEGDGRPAGCVLLRDDGALTRVDLWLAPVVWGSDLELAVLRATLNTLQRAPETIALRLGSSEHLRLSVERYKALRFELALEERFLFLKSTVT
ncbi:MAG: GNAT family N-acetyltransferase [Thermoflexales bacterium]|nr:GNAT family N-acetyltransferase [Thermoflexales bacterium]